MHALARIGATVALLFALQALAGCAAIKVEEKENYLSRAGFVLYLANTPERIAMLKRLPPNRFVRREHDTVVHFVYADPLVCGCLYIGDQKAYDQYKQARMEQRRADEQLNQLMTAGAYNDPAWSWVAWGALNTGFVPGTGDGW
jgi:hypothetical protein